MSTQTAAAQPVTATRVGPSDYSLQATRVQFGTEIAAHGENLLVVGEPMWLGTGYEARVREIGGTHDGNEFSAFLRVR